MAHRLVIYDANHHILYEGNPLNMPIKKDKIIEKSMEIFRDPDPCIIHQSYVIQSFVEDLKEHLPLNQEVLLKDLSMDASWIDMETIMSCSIELKG